MALLNSLYNGVIRITKKSSSSLIIWTNMYVVCLLMQDKICGMCIEEEQYSKPYTHSMVTTTLLGTDCCHCPNLTAQETEVQTGLPKFTPLVSAMPGPHSVSGSWQACSLGWKKLVETFTYTMWRMTSYASSGAHFFLYCHFVTYLFFTEIVIREPLEKLDTLHRPHSFILYTLYY